MVNLERLIQEFSFFRETLQKIAGNLSRDEDIDASFTIGVLHAICENHVKTLSALISAQPPIAGK